MSHLFVPNLCACFDQRFHLIHLKWAPAIYFGKKNWIKAVQEMINATAIVSLKNSIFEHYFLTTDCWLDNVDVHYTGDDAEERARVHSTLAI